MMGNLTFLYGVLFAIAGQSLSFIQLQCSAKYGWYEKYPILILLSAIPGMWMYIKSVNYFIAYFGGTIWEGRFLSFSIGIIVFAMMSWGLFREPFTMKTMVSILLAVGIISVQIIMK